VSARVNAGNAHTEGFELETSAEPIRGLTFTGTASYLDTRFDSFVIPSLVSATGNQFPISPRWQLFGGVNYVLPVHQLHDTVRVGANTTYETSYFSDIFNYKQGQVTPQDFVDGYISYHPPTESRLIFTLSAKNIANNLHYQSITWGGSPNYWDGPMAPPRTVFFKAAYSF
jgi:iron complex outermembrane receptor protein